MSILQSQSTLKRINKEDLGDIGSTAEQFLEILKGPTAIFIRGSDSRATRVVCTLLHGNEPSGVRAMHSYLGSNQIPCTNLVFIIASVEAALSSPQFSHRMLPEKRDLNRCFKEPFNDEQGLLAKQILDLIHELKPECVLDIHNTSGSGPAFGVAITGDTRHVALTSLFTNDLIVTDLRLGALMELSEREVPTVTIECGGANDPASQLIADEGLERLLNARTILENQNETYPVNIYHNPIRLETIGSAEVAYGEDPDLRAAIVLPKHAEKFNYGTITNDVCIGRLAANGFSRLSAKDHEGKERLIDYFEERDGGLFPLHPIRVFMVTTNAFIARTDCLFYFIGESK